MLGFIRKRFLRSRAAREPASTNLLKEEHWTAKFGKAAETRFKAETEKDYEVSIDKQGLTLSLKKASAMAWTVNPIYRYSDLVIEAAFRQKADGPYQAAGILFRYTDELSHYSALISTKGFFRLNLVFNGSPIDLIPWTEITRPLDQQLSRLRIIASGDRLAFIVNEAWVGEIIDSSLTTGRTAFAVADYEGQSGASARLERYRIDSRPSEVEAAFYRWNSFIRIDPAARLRLASSFGAIGQALPALIQVKKAWKDREALGLNRDQASLIMAAEFALGLALYPEAEDYLNRCIEVDNESAEAERALVIKARLLYEANKFLELRDHCLNALSWFPNNTVLLSLQGHAFWNLGAWEKAAESYRKASELEKTNVVALINLAQADEQLGSTQTAIENYLKAAKICLETESYEDLNLIVLKLKELIPNDQRTFSLSGKIAFAMEDYTAAERDLSLADQLVKNHENTDPTIPFLRGLIHLKSGRYLSALPFFDWAVAQDGTVAAFRFRAAETRLLLKQINSTRFNEDLTAALTLEPNNAWILNLAAKTALVKGDLKTARHFASQAFSIKPDDQVIIANLAELLFLESKADEALQLLSWPTLQPPTNQSPADGSLANAAGNILTRLGRFEEADQAYTMAIKADKRRLDYRLNHAACLIELGRYGEADELLAAAYETEPSSQTLELIAYVAVKKGEYARAEAAYRVGLETDSANPDLLKGLSWLYLFLGRFEAAEAKINQLEMIDSSAGAEMRQALIDASTKIITCASCGREWRVLKTIPALGSFRLIAEPPDDFPAGSCPKCQQHYCIACAKQTIKDQRLHCPKCGSALKLVDDGIKKLLMDWAASKD